MNANDFTIWLEGYLEGAAGNADIEVIRSKLASVSKSLLPVYPYPYLSPNVAPPLYPFNVPVVCGTVTTSGPLPNYNAEITGLTFINPAPDASVPNGVHNYYTTSSVRFSRPQF